MSVLTSATAPPEARGIARDQVRLLVATGHGVLESPFRALGEHLEPGDLLVVNTSATLAAAVDGRHQDGRSLVVHFAGRRHDGSWVVEVRPTGAATGPLTGVLPGDRLVLHGRLLHVLGPLPGQDRLLRVAAEVEPRELMREHGRPIRYAYVPDPWPLDAYQTVFAREPGSAEMPSAGRPFTGRVLRDLVGRGVLVAPVTLHTGLSSPDAGEPPQPEQYRVAASTAALVNHVRDGGGRVVAVGTTVTRALESAADASGRVHASEGWTGLVLGPGRAARAVSGLLTGWHDPGASHLQLLESVAGHSLVAAAYAEATRRQFLWHEFGDSCLLLP